MPNPLPAVLALAALALGAPDPAAEPVPVPDLADAAREIQNICFSTYPPEMLSRMSGREGPVPDDVLSDPRLQIEYLKTEDKAAKGLFYPSLLEELIPAFRAEIRPGQRFLDLGSGDGRVVFLAALLGAHATGIEYDGTLHRLAEQARDRLAHLVPTDRARLKQGDFFKEDFSRYDVLFYYWGHGSFLEKELLEKIAREMRGGEVAMVAFMTTTPVGLELIATHGDVRVYRRVRAD